MKYNTYTLDNGLRIIHLPSDSKVVYCGYQINAGTRNEEPGEEGLAHFCEHVTFKGTERRKAWHILNCLESVGGDLNAYTNKEGTVYYSAILKEHIARAVDLLTDIVFHSVYPQAEIDKEVEVICDEIESYNDSPAELIYDEFENINKAVEYLNKYGNKFCTVLLTKSKENEEIFRNSIISKYIFVNENPFGKYEFNIDKYIKT